MKMINLHYRKYERLDVCLDLFLEEKHVHID